MEDKVHTPLNFIKNKWFRLICSLLFAFFMALIVLLLPIAAETQIQLPLPNSLNGGEISIPLPFGAEIVQATGGLTISKTSNPSPVNQGEILTYTLILTNHTPSELIKVTITDTVPANTTCLDISSPGSGWTTNHPNCDTQNYALWYLLYIDAVPSLQYSLLPGKVTYLTYTVRIDKPMIDKSTIANVDYAILDAQDKILSTTVRFTDIGPIQLTPVNAPEWQITKAVTPTPNVEPGNPLTYTLNITNSGNLTVTESYTIFDQFPDNTNYVTNSASPTPTTIGSGVTWVLTSPLGIDQAVQVSYVVTVTNPLTNNTSIVNQTYAVTGTDVFSVGIGTPVTVYANSPVTMTVAKTDLPDPVQAGKLLTYTLTITNETTSKGPAEGLVVTDTTPANTVFESAAFVSGSGAITNPTVGGTGTISWAVTSPTSLGLGQAVQVRLTVRAQSPLISGTVLSNDDYGLTVSNTLSSLSGVTPITTTVHSAPVITLTKIVNPQVTFTNQPLTYTITVTNTGNMTATNIPFTDTLPAGFDPVTSNWSMTIPGIDLAGTLGVVTYTLSVKTPNVAGVYGNFVTTTITNNISIGPVATVTVNSPVDLQLTKTRIDGSGPVVAGNPLTYTLTITNLGPEIVDAIITDTYTTTPASGIISVISSTSVVTATCGSTNPIVCNFTNFTNTAVITLVLNTSPAFSGTLTNTATIAPNVGGIVDADPSDNTDMVTDTVRLPLADLQIGKVRVGSGDVIAGNPITYTLTITNAGPDTVNSVEVTDIFTNASGVSYTPSGGGMCSGTASPVVCTFTNFTNTETITLVLDTTVAFSGTITNTAFITFSSGITATDNIPGNNVSNDVVVPVRYPQADLQVGKVRNGSVDVLSGDSITYTITITNAGLDTISSIEVTDVFTNASGVSYTPSGGGMCSGTASPVVCTFTNFTNTETITLVLDTAVAFSGTITNTAFITFSNSITATDNIPGNNVSNDVVVPVQFPQADLQVSKQRVGGTGQVYAGSTITYTLIVTNAGGSDIVNAVLTDTISTVPGGGTTALSSIAGAGVTSCSDSHPQVVCTLNNFTNTSTITVVVTVADAYSGTITNTAFITFASGVFATEQNPDNNQYTVSNNARLALIDLQVNKQRSNGSGTVFAGNPITYTLTVTNSGPVAVDITLTDIFSPTGTGVTYNSIIPPAGAMCGGSGPVICTMSNLSGTASFILTLDTVNTYIGSVTNTATIMTSSPNVSETNTTNNTDTVTDTVAILSADLQINKVRVGSGPILSGDALTFTLTITNAGPDTVPATLIDTVSPASAVSGMSIIPPAGWSCSVIMIPNIICTNASFTPTGGIPHVATVYVTTTALFSGTLENRGNIANGAVEKDPGNIVSIVELTVIQNLSPTLTITKTASPVSNNTVNPGDTLNYIIEVGNSGSDPATNVIITDTLHSGVGYVNCSSNATSCTGGSTTVINMSSLAVGATLTATIEVTVTATVSSTQITNSATLISDQTTLVNSNLVTHTVFTTSGVGGDVYLPIIFKEFDGTCAELQITNIQNLGGNLVGVTVTNVGSCATDSNFWVDIYGNIRGTEPEDLVDVTADRRWQSASVDAQYGLGWEVPVLNSGASANLLTDGSGDSVGLSDDQNWPASLGGATVLAYADSFDSNDPGNIRYVEIRETDEFNNQSSSITVSGVGLQEENGSSGSAVDTYPPRPDLK